MSVGRPPGACPIPGRVCVWVWMWVCGGEARERAAPSGQRTRSPWEVPGVTSVSRAKGWERRAWSRGELTWPRKRQVQRSCRSRRPGASSPQERSAKWVPGSLGRASRAGVPSPRRVPLARFICSAAARSVPAPPQPARPANQCGDPGAATRAAPPPRGTAGSRTKAWVGGRGARLCLLSPRRLCPSNSRFLKEPHPGEGPCLAPGCRPRRLSRTLSPGPCPGPPWYLEGASRSLRGG